MTIRKTDSGYATVHCHGKKKGKIISKFKTKKEALAQHRAIMANKKHHSAEDGVFLETRKRKFNL